MVAASSAAEVCEVLELATVLLHGAFHGLLHSRHRYKFLDDAYAATYDDDEVSPLTPNCSLVHYLGLENAPPNSVHLRLPLTVMCDAAATAIRTHGDLSYEDPVDIVATGGGCSAYYGASLCPVFAKLCESRTMRVRKLYGVSSGAITCAFFLGCECGTAKPDDIYTLSRICAGTKYLSTAARIFLDSVLPDDVHVRASGRMHVRITELRCGRWPQKRVMSYYPSRDFFLDVVMASCILPGITGAHALRDRADDLSDVRWMDGIDVGPLSKQCVPCPSHTLPGRRLVLALNKVHSRMKRSRVSCIASYDPDFDMMCVQSLKDLVRLMVEQRTPTPATMYFVQQ